MPARSKASSVAAKASWPKSSVWLLASETASIPAACSTATFFVSDRKWKALLGRAVGSHESARTHSRLQNLQATSRKTVKVPPPRVFRRFTLEHLIDHAAKHHVAC